MTGLAGTAMQTWWDCGTSPAPDGPSGVREEVNTQRERERWVENPAWGSRATVASKNMHMAQEAVNQALGLVATLQ